MAISQIQAYGLLDDWRAYCLENVWWFNQITGVGATLAETPVYVQPDRDVVARAIYEAFHMMETYLGFSPVPIFTYDEIELSGRTSIAYQQLALNKGYLVEIGRRATTLIDDAVTVTYSAVGGLGVDDTATITITDSTTALDEIRVFFRVTDGADSAASELYEITPTRKSRSGSTVTIVADRPNFIKPNGLWLRPYVSPNFLEPNPGTSTDATQFVTLVDVYRVYADDSAAVTLVGPGDCSENCDEDTCTACARIVRKTEGIVRVDSSSCCVYPEQVRIYYRAGYPLLNGRIDPAIGIALFRLANSLMPRQPCSINNRDYDVWADDRRVDEGQVPPALVGNPFGIKRGQLAAWQTVARMALGKGGSMSSSRMMWSQW